MTDRVKGFTVTLERDIRIDDFQRIKEAVEMIVGVQHVEPTLVTHQDHMVRTRLKHDITRNILKLIDETE
jgi:hypothetical protein